MPRVPDPRFTPNCSITFDGEPVPARAGEPVAAALLAAGRTVLARSSKYHRPRGAFCLAGSCNQCLARVDGMPNQRTCRTPSREGLVVETQNALGSAEHDLLGLVDLVYSRGLDHHGLMTWNRFANRAAVALSRQLAGLGKLPDRVAPLLPPASEEHVDVLVVGAGPAGLAAAEELAAARRQVLLVDREVRAGGHLRCRLGLPGEPDSTWPEDVLDATRKVGGEVALATSVLGLWTDGGLCAALLSHAPEPRVRLVRPRRVILATGTHAQPAAFQDSDMPGIFAARGLLVALGEFGVVPGQRAAVLGTTAEAKATASRLAAAGMHVTTLTEEPLRATGHTRLAGLTLADGTRLECDTLAVATWRQPAAELARLVGARFEFSAATARFAVTAGGDEPADASAPGASVAPGVWIAGEVAGALVASTAMESGRRVAAAVLAEVSRG